MTVTVRYFAVLRDHRGVPQESVDTRAPNVGQLYLELGESHSFPLSATQVRFAVNGSYVPSDHVLKDGDEVVFIPPVAGG